MKGEDVRILQREGEEKETRKDGMRVKEKERQRTGRVDLIFHRFLFQN